jgi:hypothetical protein
MKFIEMYYWIFNIAYYRIMVVKDMEVLKTLIQPVIASPKLNGSDFAFIDKKGKKAWFKMPENCFRQGKRFIGMVDVDNAIQLIEDTKVKVEGDGLIIKEMTITTLKSSMIAVSDEKTGKMKKFVTAFPTQLLFEICSAHFVREALKNPKEKQDWSLVVIILILAVVGLIGFYLMNRGG